jgi:hypothetical protein
MPNLCLLDCQAIAIRICSQDLYFLNECDIACSYENRVEALFLSRDSMPVVAANSLIHSYIIHFQIYKHISECST